jgi:hypothetical protein
MLIILIMMKRAMRANSHKGESKIGVANDYYGEPAFAGSQVPRPTGVIRAGMWPLKNKL